MNSYDHIERRPEVLLGKPVFRGTRIPVDLVLRKLGEGASESDLLEAYPRLGREQIQAALLYAASILNHEETVLLDPPLGKTAQLRFLADESLDFGAVRALREAGFDVLAIVELDPGISDLEVAARGESEGRLLLTEDKDFGQLVHAAGAAAHGVVLVRFPGGRRREMIDSVVAAVERLGERLRGRFVVVQPGRVRISGLPGSAV